MGRASVSDGEGIDRIMFLTQTMKKLVNNIYLVMIARLIISIVFIYASIDKLNDPAPFAQSIGNYKIFSQQIALIIATILPWLELLCGISLFLGLFTKGSSLTTSILLFLFTAIVISALARSLDISCGCFTQDPNAHKLGWMKVAENIGLFILSIFLLFSSNTKFSLDRMRKENTI